MKNIKAIIITLFIFFIATLSSNSFAADKWVKLNSPVSKTYNLTTNVAGACQGWVDHLKTPGALGSYTFVSYAGRCWDLGGKIRVEIQYAYCTSSACYNYGFYDLGYTQLTEPCSSGYTYNNTTNQCEKECPAAGTASGDSSKYIFPANAASVCHNGCSIKVSPEICNLAECLGWLWQYEGTSCIPGTGSSSVKEPVKPEQSNDPKNPTSPADCLEAGLSFGYVGDKIVCHQPTSSDPVSKTTSQTKTKTDASGVATTETTKTTTTDYGDKVKVEVSTSGGGGGGGSGSGSGSGSGTGTGDGSGDGSGSTETTEGDKSAYCEDNPNAEICKQEEEDPIDCEEGSLVEKLICESTKWEKGGDPGKFDLEPVYAEILEAKDNYTNEFNTIRASFSNLFNISLPHGTGSTAFTGHFRTNEIKVDMNEYPDLFSYLPTIVMIAAGIACIFIIFL